MTDRSNAAWANDVYRPKEQKAALLAFAEAIGARRKLGEDEAGNPRIEGKHGRVYVQPHSCDPGRSPKYQLVMLCESPQRWKFAREALSAFAEVTNNGHDEGMLLMTQLPTESEGEVIRDKLGIPKRKVYSEEDLSRMRARMALLNASANDTTGSKSPSSERPDETLVGDTGEDT